MRQASVPSLLLLLLLQGLRFWFFFRSFQYLWNWKHASLHFQKETFCLWNKNKNLSKNHESHAVQWFSTRNIKGCENSRWHSGHLIPTILLAHLPIVLACFIHRLVKFRDDANPIQTRFVARTKKIPWFEKFWRSNVISADCHLFHLANFWNTGSSRSMGSYHRWRRQTVLF